MAAEVMFFIILALTKCSVAMLCRRLFSINMKKNLLICDITVGVCAVWALGAILTVAVDCGPLPHIGYDVPFCQSLVSKEIVSHLRH